MSLLPGMQMDKEAYERSFETIADLVQTFALATIRKLSAETGVSEGEMSFVVAQVLLSASVEAHRLAGVSLESLMEHIRANWRQQPTLPMGHA